MVLRIRDFRLLWLGQTVSQLGNQFNYIALAWMVLQLTGSSTAMGAVYLAQVLPNALFGWVAGLVIDRFDRRRLMMGASIVRGLLVALLPLSFSEGHMSMALVYGVTFAVSTLTLVFYASEKTVIPMLVPDEALTEANAYAEMTSQISALIGPVLAGLLIAVLRSPVYALYLDALGFAASALALSRLTFRDERRSDETASGMGEQAMEGFRFLLSERFLLTACLTIAAANFFVGPFSVIFPVLSERDLHTGSVGFGWLMGGIGGGMLLGSLFTARLTALLSNTVLVYGGMIVIGIAFAAVGLAPTLPSAVMGAAVAGFLMAPANAVLFTLVQHLTPPHLQGRVFSMLFAMASLAMPAGVAIVSVLLDPFGARMVLLWTGGLTAVTAALTLAFLPPQPTYCAERSLAVTAEDKEKT